jgi:GDPmannose 4,6-dehydratase
LDPFNPIVIIDSKYYRPLEVDELQADITAAKTHLGWNPEYSFNELVKEMVIEDVKILSTRT